MSDLTTATFEKASETALKVNIPETVVATTRTHEMDDLRRELKRLTEQQIAYAAKFKREIMEITALIAEAEKLGIKSKLDIIGGVKP
jgi:hypothetical protein